MSQSYLKPDHLYCTPPLPLNKMSIYWSAQQHEGAAVHDAKMLGKALRILFKHTESVHPLLPTSIHLLSAWMDTSWSSHECYLAQPAARHCNFQMTDTR